MEIIHPNGLKQIRKRRQNPFIITGIVLIITLLFLTGLINKDKSEDSTVVVDLSLDLTLSESTFSMNQSMNVTINLTNHGDDILVGGLKMRSPSDYPNTTRALNLWLITPSNVTLIGERPLAECVYKAENLENGMRLETVIDLQDVEFRMPDDTLRYQFEEGTYFLSAVFSSRRAYVESEMNGFNNDEDNGVWNGTVTSNNLSFTITE